MKRVDRTVFYDDEINEEFVYDEELYDGRKLLKRIDYTFRFEMIRSVFPKNKLSTREIYELKKELKNIFETTIDKYFEKNINLKGRKKQSDKSFCNNTGV